MKAILYIFGWMLVAGNCFAQKTVSDRELFDSMRRQMRKEYSQYRKQNEKEYAAYLRQTWVEYQLHKGIDPFSAPKPDTIPTAREEEHPITFELKAKTIDETLRAPEIPQIILEKKDSRRDAFKAEVLFYGTNISISHSLKTYKLTSTEEEDISALWESFGTNEITNLLADIITIKLEKRLNDWALFLFIEKLTDQLPQLQDANTRTIFRHYALYKLGFGVRLGAINQTLVLLIPFQEMIYNHKFLSENGKKYFLFTDKESSASGAIYTLPLFINDTGRPMGIQLKENMILAYTPHHIKRSYQNATITGTVNINRINFFKDFPQADFRVFANAVADIGFENDLLEQLQSLITGQTVPAALNWLLHFTQTAFGYATDQEQFGYEKYFFPEETFFYPYSDCEDRAIFFSYLVRKLLKLEVVLLSYPNHIATGVLLNEDIPGTYIRTTNKRYLVCDPTYISANIGQCMPECRNENPIVMNL